MNKMFFAGMMIGITLLFASVAYGMYGDEKLYVCCECDDSFEKECVLESHLIEVHSYSVREAKRAVRGDQYEYEDV